MEVFLLKNEIDDGRSRRAANRTAGTRSGGRLLGFFAAFGIGLLLVHYPGVGHVQQLSHRQQVVEGEAVGFLPAFLLLVASAGVHAVPVAFGTLISPDRDLEIADADFVSGLSHVDSPSLV
jgi:hypothetical protein